MRSLVIDANVFHAFAQESVLQIINAERTRSPLALLESLGRSSVAFLDSGGQIESEWKNLAQFAAEWFQTWLAEAFANGRIYEVDPSADPHLTKRYGKLGFPRGKDIWYIKTAHGLSLLCARSRPCLVAEDVDFFDPSRKAVANKRALFLAGDGPISTQLKRDGIDVRCIERIHQELQL